MSRADHILSILNEDYRPALTVKEIKVETAVRGLGHQGTGYDLETIREALTRLRAVAEVDRVVRRIGKTTHTILWYSKSRLCGVGFWEVLRVAGIREYQAQETKAQAGSGDQSPGC